jgi:hypothetical protein
LDKNFATGKILYFYGKLRGKNTPSLDENCKQQLEDNVKEHQQR